MNRPLLGRVVPFIFAFYAVSFIAFAGYAYITFTVSLFLPALRWEYALKRGFVFFMDYLIPVHAAAIAVAASLAAGSQAPRALGGPAQPFNKVISSTVAMFLVLTAGYAVLYEGVYPVAHRRLSDMRYESSLAREFMSQSKAAQQGGNFVGALDLLDRYLAINPQDKQAREQRPELAGNAAHQKGTKTAREVAGLAASESLDAQGLMEKAQYYFNLGDWLSAHYYAQSAVTLDPRRVDALQMAAQAMGKLGGVSAQDTERKTGDLFQQKKAAYQMLISGDTLGAYYTFTALAGTYKDDPDIKRYLEEARSKVAQTTFFVDEAHRVGILPGVQQILFLDHTAEGTSEVVSIGKMVELPAGDAYFYDIEAIRFDSRGAIQWHFAEPYGRREGSSILMHCIDSKDARIQYLPIYLQGSRPAAERAVLALRPGITELRALSARRDALADTGLAELYRMRGVLGSLGMSRQALNVEMTMRFLMPFAFLIVSLFAVAMGWAFRVRTLGRLPLFPALLTPLVPIVLAVLSLLYIYAHRVIAGFAVLAFGLGTALVILGVLQAVLLGFSLVMLAGQSTR
jgi:tetratricopeptide (TPR) repeat protein